MTQLLMPGQETYMAIRRAAVNGQPGPLVFTLLVQMFHDGVSLVFDNHSILNKTFPTREEGRAYLRFLKAEAAAGTELWLIVERAGAWTSAAAAMNDAERQLVDGINAAIDERAAELTANADAQREQVADIVNGPRTWAAFRQNARPVRPSRTNRHVKPLTPAQLDRMRQHRNGVVTRGDGQSWRLLDAIEQRGYGTVEAYEPGTRKIRAVRLNGRGWQAIGQTAAVAA